GSDGAVKLEGNGTGWGFNVGLHYKPVEEIELGLTYRHGMTMKVNDGTASFSAPHSLQSSLPANGTTGFSTRLPLPHITTLGMAYNVNSRLTLQGDLVFAIWSRYKSLDFTFDENTALVQNSSEVKKNNNTLAVR